MKKFTCKRATKPAKTELRREQGGSNEIYYYRITTKNQKQIAEPTKKKKREANMVYIVSVCVCVFLFTNVSFIYLLVSYYVFNNYSLVFFFYIRNVSIQLVEVF